MSHHEAVEPPPDIQATLTYHLHSLIFTYFLSGVFTCIVVVMSVHAFVKQRKNKCSIIMPFILIQYALLLCPFISSGRRRVQDFMKDSSEDVMKSIFLPKAVTILWENICLCVAFGVADGLIVWRCGKMWNRNVWITAVLGLLSVIEIGLKAYILYLRVVLMPLLKLDAQTNSMVALGYALDTAACFIGAIITLTASFLIILRIYTLGRIQGVRRFKLVVQSVVESALLYSIPLLLAGILNAIRCPLGTFRGFVNALNLTMPGIAPTLLFLRTHLGVSEPDSAWEQPISIVWTRFLAVLHDEEGEEGQAVSDVRDIADIPNDQDRAVII